MNDTRQKVFAESTLNRELCAIQEAVVQLGEATEAFLAAKHEESYAAALEAAGLVPLPTYQERVNFHMLRESLTLIASTARLTYEVMSHTARPNYTVPDGVPPGTPITLIAADDS